MNRHICAQNESTDRADECRIFRNEGTDFEWYLSVDCGAANTPINFCPYCGVMLNSWENEFETLQKLSEVDDKGFYKFPELREKHIKRMADKGAILTKENQHGPR